MKTIGLIACSSTKQSGTHCAAELYTSPLFRMSRAWVERNCADGWYILSAQHHLVHPDALVTSYDRTLREMSRAERSAWASKVALQLDALMPCSFFVLAGQLYCQALDDFTFERPLQGLGIGRQLQWLKRHA